MLEKTYYVRHGQTTDNRDGIISGGGRDVDLSPLGETTAHALASLVERLENITSICVGPLRRTRRTAELLNSQVQRPVFIVTALKEWDVGDCTGKPESECGNLLSNWSYDPPGGESRAALRTRAQLAWDECHAVKLPGDTLIVAHSGLWRAMSRNLGLPTDELDNCRILEIRHTGRIWQSTLIQDQ
jgi:probable phosphoglycerate mutase